jgi:lipopolysaccharide transport system permease protein
MTPDAAAQASDKFAACRGPVPWPTRASGLRRALMLTAHLVRRDIAATNRFSVIGAGWPLVGQLVQVAVLVIVFSAVVRLEIPDYPAYVFCGLIGWSWFVASINGASDAVRGRRELAMRPGFPTIVLPMVAAAMPFVDVLFALPVLAIMLAAASQLHETAPLFVALLAVQAVLIVGLAWIIAAAGVFFRDVPNIVRVVLLMGFYVTPVYFDVSRVPEHYQWLVWLNPMAVLLEAQRAVLMGTPFPPVGVFAAVVALAGVLFALGLLLFGRVAPAFSDEL